MAKILAYSAHGAGHVFPLTPILDELAARGHHIAVRTLSAHVPLMQARGFSASRVSEQVESIEEDDWQASNPRRALQRSVRFFCARAEHDAPDLQRAIADEAPDAVLVDINGWGALAAAEAWGGPWAALCPYPLPLRSADVPPFGPGLAPASGALGHLRNTLLRPVVLGAIERIMRPALNDVRAQLQLTPLDKADDLFRKPPLMIYLTAEPFEYPRRDWPGNVLMVGPCEWEPPSVAPPWLAEISGPVVLVTTSSEFQNDGRLVQAALDGLADEPYAVVATLPAGDPTRFTPPANARVVQFLPHGPVLDRAVCAVTHGGHGRYAKGPRPRRTGLRCPLRTRPARSRSSRRGCRRGHPAFGPPPTARPATRQGPRSNDPDRRSRKGCGRLRHRGRCSRCRRRGREPPTQEPIQHRNHLERRPMTKAKDRSNSSSRRHFLAEAGVVGSGLVATSLGVAPSSLLGRADAAPVLPHQSRGTGTPGSSRQFGRLFPELQPFAHANDRVRAALLEVGMPGGIMDANDNLAAGAKALIVDPTVNGNPTAASSYGTNPDNPTMTAGSTFVGQFTDHDITFDQTSQLGVPQNPLISPNTRTPALDLDSVLGGGPGRRPDLYVSNLDGSAGPKLKLGSGGIHEDVPRVANGDGTYTALLGDPRNDENVMIAGLHCAHILFYNRVIDELPHLDLRRIPSARTSGAPAAISST